jgi:hypothetical protein
MADLKISALPSSTTPLAGTEVLPIVQSSTTKQVSVTNLTSGRTVDMSIGLVNTTTARTNVLGSVTNSFQVEGTAGNNSSGQMVRNSANANGPSFYLGKSRSATVNGNTVVASGDTLGRIDFLGADGTNLVRAASIYVTVDGTPGTNDMPGKLAFLTSPDGTVSPVERLTIDNAGVVTVSSDNVVMNTAGKGINFTANTNAAGMTSELLNWYEEGTWTPTYAFWTINPTNVYARYTRVGRLVTLNFVAQDGVSVAGNSTIGGLPFTSSNVNGASVAMKDMVGSSPGITAFGAIVTNSTLIGSMTSATFTGTFWAFSTTYMV